MKTSIIALWTSLALSSCASSPRAADGALQASRFQPTADAEGFSTLWEVRESRCKKTGTAEAPSFAACRSFEWQTPLYNTSTAPRTMRVTLRSLCTASDKAKIYLAIAPHPAEIIDEKSRVRVSKPMHELEVNLETGSRSLDFQLPSKQKATLFAYLPALPATVSADCRIQYRIEQQP